MQKLTQIVIILFVILSLNCKSSENTIDCGIYETTVDNLKLFVFKDSISLVKGTHIIGKISNVRPSSLNILKLQGIYKLLYKSEIAISLNKAEGSTIVLEDYTNYKQFNELKLINGNIFSPVKEAYIENIEVYNEENIPLQIHESVNTNSYCICISNGSLIKYFLQFQQNLTAVKQPKFRVFLKDSKNKSDSVAINGPLIIPFDCMNNFLTQFNSIFKD